MKIFLKTLRIVGAFIVASTISGIFFFFMLMAAADVADREVQEDNLQYSCASSDNYAHCYQAETGRSVISISGGFSANTHLMIGGVMTLFVFLVIFIAVGFPKLRSEMLEAMK